MSVKVKAGIGLLALLVAGIVVTQIDKVPTTGRSWQPVDPHSTNTRSRQKLERIVHVTAYTSPGQANIWVEVTPPSRQVNGEVVDPGRMWSRSISVHRGTAVNVRLVGVLDKGALECSILLDGREVASCPLPVDGETSTSTIVP